MHHHVGQRRPVTGLGEHYPLAIDRLEAPRLHLVQTQLGAGLDLQLVKRLVGPGTKDMGQTGRDQGERESRHRQRAQHSAAAESSGRHRGDLLPGLQPAKTDHHTQGHRRGYQRVHEQAELERAHRRHPVHRQQLRHRLGQKPVRVIDQRHHHQHCQRGQRRQQHACRQVALQTVHQADRGARNAPERLAGFAGDVDQRRREERLKP